jgi:hypothetical protein
MPIDWLIWRETRWSAVSKSTVRELLDTAVGSTVAYLGWVAQWILCSVLDKWLSDP